MYHEIIPFTFYPHPDSFHKRRGVCAAMHKTRKALVIIIYRINNQAIDNSICFYYLYCRLSPVSR